MSYKVVFFGYSWSDSFKPDAYQTAIINAFVRSGAEVHVVLSNYLVRSNGTFGMRDSLSQDAIINFINDLSADLVFSMNHGGMSLKIQAGIRCPIVTWFVDDFTHIFYPEGAGKFREMFGEKVQVIVSSYKFQKQVLEKAPELKGRVHFFSSATQIKDFKAVQRKQDKNICFVGSFMDYGPLLDFLVNALKRPDVFRKVGEVCEKLSKNYDLDFVELLDQVGIRKDVEDLGLSPVPLQMLLANTISNQERSQVLEKLKDLGFVLYGNSNWLHSVVFSPGVLNCFQAGEKVTTHSDLVEIYQSSKISINIPQIQAGPALPYRVFDILASNSLLITKYLPDSDAFQLFGKDCPIPMYKNLDHLRELCQYYLEHEEERRALVRKCNALVENGFSFDDRIRNIMDLAKLPLPASSSPGKAIYLGINSFDTLGHVCRRNLRDLVRGVVKGLIRLLIVKPVRYRLVGFLRSLG